MRTARVGTLEVSMVGLGCNNFGRALDGRESAEVVNAALDAGVTFFDTARTYGNGRSEAFLGAALGSRRNQVVIATKFGRIPRQPEIAGAGREDVHRTVERSLVELGTDYIDLYQLHFPDDEVPIAETLEALSELVEQGKVREIGCANFDPDRLIEALEASGERRLPRFVSDQVHYSVVHREPEENGLAAVCQSREVALLPYYPLASGLLTGKARRGERPPGRLGMERYSWFLTEENFDVVAAVESFATHRRLSVVQVALRWLLSRPAVPAVTPGATRPEQIRANVAALDWEPSDDDIAELDALLDSV